MGYLLSAIALAAVLAIAQVVTESGSEYFAQYVMENEPNDLGASTAARPARSG